MGGNQSIPSWLVWLTTILLFVLSFSLFSWNNNFTLGFHVDEVRKVDLIRYDLNEYKHPLYMRESVKPILNLLDIPKDDPQKIARVCRYWAAFHGAAIVVFAFLLMLSLASFGIALSTTVLLMSMPIMAVHSHYFKEDVFFLAFLVAGLYLMRHELKSKKLITLLLTGIALGLMLSTHYKSAVFMLIFLLMHLLELKNLKRTLLMGLVSGLVFLVVNFSLFTEFELFWTDLVYEYDHFKDGHSFPITLGQTFGLFYIRQTFIPELGIVSLIVLAFFLIYKREMFKDSIPKWIGLMILIYWLTIEISPNKVHPNISRYALPMVPLLLVLFSSSLDRLPAKFKNAAIVLVVGMSIYPAMHTYQYLSIFKDDTRTQVLEDWWDNRDSCYYELYALPHKDQNDQEFLYELDLDSLINEGYTKATISGFWYERFFYGMNLRGASEEVIYKGRFYSLALECSTKEYLPRYEPYAFSNPEVYQFDLVEFRDRLKKEVTR